MVMKTSMKQQIWKSFDFDKRRCKTDDKEGENEVFHNCLECQCPLIVYDNLPTCTNMQCGTMYTNVLDYSPEWRFYNAADKNSSDPRRCGNPINPLLKESSFGCKILCDSRSSYEMKKICKWAQWQSTPHKEKSLYEEFQFITTMAQNAGIPKIFIDYAMIIHKDISEQQMFRGVNRDGIKAASIYLSCLHNGCQRTSHEIALIFKLDKSSATTGCKKSSQIWNNIERHLSPSQKIKLVSPTPLSFIDRYCSYLKINPELSLLAKFVTLRIKNTENTPQSSACGVLYFISETFHLGITKLEIKNVCGVSEVTINKCYQKFNSKIKELIPTCVLQKYSKH